MLQEMMKSKERVEYIDHQDKKLMFQYGNGFVVVLLTKKMLHILRSKLKQLTEDIERIYGDQIINWNGSLDIFPQMHILVKKNFEEK